MENTYDKAINTGIEKGRQKGLQTGRQEEKSSVILNMLKMELDLTTIIKRTSASEGE